jgi:hypothetical protein
MYPLLNFDLYYMETGVWIAGKISANGEDICHLVGSPKRVDEQGNEVKYDDKKDKYQYIKTKEWIEDEDFCSYEENPFV